MPKLLIIFLILLVICFSLLEACAVLGWRTLRKKYSDRSASQLMLIHLSPLMAAAILCGLNFIRPDFVEVILKYTYSFLGTIAALLWFIPVFIMVKKVELNDQKMKILSQQGKQ